MTLRLTPLSIALLAVFIGLPILLWLNEELFIRFFRGAPGLATIAGLAFVGNFTVVLPAPSFGFTMPVAVQLADQNGIVLISALYALGAALGESSGYMLGRKGANIPVLGNSRWNQALERWLRGSRTDVALAILSFIPVVLPFDVGGMIAGSMKHPWWRFLVFTFLGRWLKYWLFIQIWQTAASLSGYVALSLVFGALAAAAIAAWHYRAPLLGNMKSQWTRLRREGLHIRFEPRWGW